MGAVMTYTSDAKNNVTSDPLNLQRPHYIRRAAELRQLVDRLKNEPLLAVDTESNSLFAYFERVCLIQLSTRTADYLIDPLAFDNLRPLGDLLADPAIEIVFHAAEYDIVTLKRDFEFTFANLFDTMLAARTCGWTKIGLGSILEEQFGLRVDKTLQRADWAKRPLPPEQLRYAQIDTHFLPELRDRFVAELTERGRLEEAREMFAALADLPPAARQFDPEGYWRIHQVRDLKRGQIAIVRELYLLRDQIARQRDWPPFKVFTDETMIHLALLVPRRMEDLQGIRGLNERLIERSGPALLQAIARGSHARPPVPPRSRTLDPEVQARYEALKEWRKQRAAERGVESDVILSREILWTLAREVPTSLEDLDRIPGLGPWRKAAYGTELLQVLGESHDDQ